MPYRYIIVDTLKELGEFVQSVQHFEKAAAQAGVVPINNEPPFMLMTAGDAEISFGMMSKADPEFPALSNALRLYRNGTRWSFNPWVTIVYGRGGSTKPEAEHRIEEKESPRP